MLYIASDRLSAATECLLPWPKWRNYARLADDFSQVFPFSFKNDACIASLTKNGTCYTASECVQKNGVSDGTCAQGYGICCTCEIKVTSNCPIVHN
jgi:hypothetical protein